MISWMADAVSYHLDLFLQVISGYVTQHVARTDQQPKHSGYQWRNANNHY